MHHDKARHQTSIEQIELPLEDRGEAPRAKRSGEAATTAPGLERSGADDLMEQIVERSTLARALKRVRQNQGSAGIDGMTVDELVPYLREGWPAIREQLLTGRYQPSAVRQHEIPKGDGRMRPRGIPTVLDRFMQQAVFQVLHRDSIPGSRSPAMAFGQGGGPMTPYVRHTASCRAADAGWSTSIWQHSLIASITIFSWGSCTNESRTAECSRSFAGISQQG